MWRESPAILHFKAAGERLVGVFSGAPYVNIVHGTGAKERRCPQRDCPLCEEGQLPRFEALFNLYLPSEGRMRVLLGDVSGLEDILRVTKKFGLEKMRYELECRQLYPDRPPRYLLLPDGPLSAAQQSRISQAPLYNLKALSHPGAEPQALYKTPTPPQTRLEEPITTDLKDSLRFVHTMAMQTRFMGLDVRVKAQALVEELVAGGHLDLLSFEERRGQISERERPRFEKQSHVQLAEAVDKYTLQDLPEIDCISRLPLCKARCCALNFSLSVQDLNEGVVEWSYAAPYQIRQRKDGYCVHCAQEGIGCTIYAQRPAVCRGYSCREDKRIWQDFEARLPAPPKEQP